ncbi:MAG: lytic murein transglycosylase, partial [Colwellia sp.]
MHYNQIIKSIVFMVIVFLSPSKFLQAKTLNEAGFTQYVIQLKKEALAQGFNKNLIKTSFAHVKFHERAVKADRKQPETVETLDTYLPKRVPSWKVKKARELYTKHQHILTKIGRNYNVQPRFIVALWGLETNFG